MNTWMKRVLTVLLVAVQFVNVSVASATTNEKEKVEIELKQTQKEIDEKLSEASDITIALEELATEIQEQTATIEQTEVEIQEQETRVEERYEYTAEQLKVMQKSEVNQNIVIGLFQSENFSDFINRLYTISVLTSANEELLKEAHNEYKKLNSMKEDLVVNKEELDKKKEETAQQKATLDEKLVDLKSKLAVNNEKLEKINAEEAAQKRAEANKATVASSSASSASNSSKETSNSSKETSNSSKEASKSTTSPKVSKANAGSWMTFESTAYSYKEPGLTHKTATGVSLLRNSRVVAVDPRVIPLGSLVEVEGMGIYLAADTGGAIKGKRIDVHFSNLAEVPRWGRRNVRIRVLN